MSEMEYVTKELHTEFAHRIDEENSRQNIRLDALEVAVKEINKLTVSIERIATTLESMVKELQDQGARLDEIEKKPAKRWDVVVTGALSALIGAVMAALLAGKL